MTATPCGLFSWHIKMMPQDQPQNQPQDQPQNQRQRRDMLRLMSALPLLSIQLPLSLSLSLSLLPVASASAGTAVVDGTLGGHGYFYPPVLLPDFGVTDHTGKHASFRQILHGHISLVQLIFTSCSNVCPIQGATFSQLQELIPTAYRSKVQLLSMTIDPLNDNPEALAAWLKQFNPLPMWKALRPDLNAIDTVRQLLNQNKTDVNSHLSEVLLVDASSRLVWRSSELPSSEALADKVLALFAKR